MVRDEGFSVVVLFVVVVISVSAVVFMLVNSKSNQPKQFFNSYLLTGGVVRSYCSNTNGFVGNGGIDPYVVSVTTTDRLQIVDRCTSTGVVKYYCTLSGEIGVVSFPCPFGCYNGACIRHALVGYSFDPFLNSDVRRVLSN